MFSSGPLTEDGVPSLLATPRASEVPASASIPGFDAASLRSELGRGELQLRMSLRRRLLVIVPLLMAALWYFVLPSMAAQPTSVSIEGPTTVAPGATTEYRITVGNDGGGAIVPVTVTAKLPDGFQVVSTSPPADVNGSTVTFALPSMPAGTVETPVITATVPATQAPGPISASATLSVTGRGGSTQSTSAIASGSVVAGGVQASSVGPVTSSGPIHVSIPVTGVAEDLMLGLLIGACLICSGSSLLTGMRLNPHAVPVRVRA